MESLRRFDTAAITVRGQLACDDAMAGTGRANQVLRQYGGFASRQHPRNDVATAEIEHHIERIAFAIDRLLCQDSCRITARVTSGTSRLMMGRRSTGTMTQYSTAFKARVLQRLVGRRAISANRLAAEVGVRQAMLSPWLATARSVSCGRAHRRNRSESVDTAAVVAGCLVSTGERSWVSTEARRLMMHKRTERIALDSPMTCFARTRNHYHQCWLAGEAHPPGFAAPTLSAARSSGSAPAQLG